MSKSYFSLFAIVSSLLFLLWCKPANCSPIPQTWSHTTVRITDASGNSIGTGFLVGHDDPSTQRRIFLVTNKHVLAESEENRQKAVVISAMFNVKNSDGTIHSQQFLIPIKTTDNVLWREHPNPYVDVLAIEVTDFIKDHQEIDFLPANAYEDFVSESDIQEFDIGEDTDILLIGYPLGITPPNTCKPLVRIGILSSDIKDPVFAKIENKDVSIPAFYIDAHAVPGSSGSPIVLRPGLWHTNKSTNSTGIGGYPPKLLGIQSQTTRGLMPLPEVPTTDGKISVFPFLADLGVCFNVETIKETLEQFFENKPQATVPNLTN